MTRTQMNLDNTVLLKPDMKDHMLYDSPSMKCPELANLRDRKPSHGYQGLGGRVARERLLMGTGFLQG